MPFFLTQYLKSVGGNNFGKVTDRIYRSAQLNKKELLKVHVELGITLNINLRADLESEELVEIRAAGMEPVWIPMSDKTTPIPAQVAQALIMLRRPEIKLINCKGGRHRTGLIVACYRVCDQNWTKLEAWLEAEHYGYYSAFGHGALKDWFWDEFKPED
jgi:hypothetical protein